MKQNENEEQGPEQGPLFVIEGPDEDGCVWICSSEGRDSWCANLGPCEAAAEVMIAWMQSIDYGERGKPGG
jgi:hypothetical protein